MLTKHSRSPLIEAVREPASAPGRITNKMPNKPSATPPAFIHVIGSLRITAAKSMTMIGANAEMRVI
jgi:hypothetical protein